LAALQEFGKIEVSNHCDGIFRDRPGRRIGPPGINYFDGYIIDNADQPTSWSGFVLDEPTTADRTVVRLVSAEAEMVGGNGSDSLDAIAPSLLRAQYKYREWFNSPSQIIPHERRSSYRKSFRVEER
jgi:hypothetical protein